MIDKHIRRHAREFWQRFRSHKFEKTESGLYFPAARVAAGGVYSFSPDGGKTWQDAPNLITEQGREHLLGVALAGQSAVAGWYMALFGSNYTPTSALTAATFPVTAGELTSGTEGYSNPTRRQWTPGPVDNAEVSNQAAPAEFAMKTASHVTVWGAALLSEQAKGSTAGVLMSAANFGVDMKFVDGSTFPVRYRVYLSEV